MITDAERFQFLLKNGRCNEKSGHGVQIDASRLKAHASFRYWCDEETYIKELDKLIEAKKESR